MSDTNLTVERKGGTGHYVISAFVVDQDDCEFLHSLQFWGYDADDIDVMKESYMASLEDNKLVLS
jgi:hypothetical protein